VHPENIQKNLISKKTQLIISLINLKKQKYTLITCLKFVLKQKRHKIQKQNSQFELI